MALKGPRTGSYTNAVNLRYNFNRLPTADFVLAQTPTVPDEYFKDTTLLLSTSSTNGAQNNTFLDSSNNNFTITRNGNATQGTYSPYSYMGWSNYFDGTGDYLTIPANSAFDFGTADYTIEGWINVSTTSWTLYATGGAGSQDQFSCDAGTLYWAYSSFSGGVSFFTSADLNKWTHVAVSRYSGTTRIFKNGTVIATSSTVASIGSSVNTLQIGRRSDGSYLTNGYMSNIRVLKGTGLYTSDFTPSTSPLTAISNTSLLTCQSNRFIDNSTNNFTITRSGDVSIQPFSPFNPTEEYSTTTVGGSAYFDGSGDYLTVPDNSSYGYGTGDFTIEFWMYPNSVGLQTVVSNLTSASSTNPHLYISSTIRYYTANADRITGASLVTGQWYHIALCRNSGSTRLFVNGIQSGSTYSDTNNYGSSAPFGIGTYWNGASPVNENTFNGYISNLRILKGTGLYTGNFTPPSLPVTTAGSSTPYANTSNVNTTFAAANTSLLCNFTNAGIFDATARNILETVGNAQASQTQTKFGASSMYFDGTGDYLKGAYSPNMILSGDFTIECWINFSAHQNYGGIVSFANPNTLNAPTSGWAFVFYSTTDRLYFEAGGGVGVIATNATPANQWNHVAVVRSGSTITHYLNGVANGSGTSSANFTPLTTDNFVIGSNRGFDASMTGYIDDLRITRGYARYTANFTPPSRTFALR